MPRPRRSPRRMAEPEPLDLERALSGTLRVEQKRDGAWNVQPQRASTAVKTYRCPGCELDIVPGIAHVVAWRADGIMGEEIDLAGRRHWHSQCWRIRP